MEKWRYTYLYFILKETFMTTADAKALLEEKLDIHRSQYRSGLILLLASIVILIAAFILDVSLLAPKATAILILVGLSVFALGLYLYNLARNPRRSLRRCLDDLKDQNKLEEAAAALDAPEEGVIGGTCRLSGGYLFAPETGVVLPVKEAGWVYVRYAGNRRLSLLCETCSFGNTFTLLTLPKDATTADTEDVLQQARELLPEALIGYSKENKEAWKAQREARWKEFTDRLPTNTPRKL